jgi:Flp pilus assembly pilin Flp
MWESENEIMNRRKIMSHLKTVRQFLTEEDGMGTVEVILIIVVLVGLVVIFKEKITDIVNSIFTKITNQTKKI